MSEKELQIQIDEVNRKLDLILEEASSQKQNRDAVNDLVNDLSLVGKDAFNGMVDSLDHAGIELDGDALNHMLMSFLRNLGNINMLLQTLENVSDLVKDASPILKEIGLDAVDKFKEVDDKGYFEVLKQILTALDNVMSRYSREDLQNISSNVETIVDTMIILMDPAVLKNVEIFAKAYKEIDQDNVPEYSIWKVMKDLRRPDMKKSIGFIMTFMRKINERVQAQ